nr:hypothetical protein [Tanacetum cinerariifolium]
MTELSKSQPKKPYEEDLESEIVMVKMPGCMSFLCFSKAYDEPIGNLDKMGDELENPSPQSISQVLPSFGVYTPPVTVKETIGIPIEVELLDETQLEALGLNTCNHDIPLSSREVLSIDEPEPQPQPYLIKYGYKKDNCELNYKFLNNLQPEWKQYGDVNDALGYKKKAVVVTSDPLALVAEKMNVSKRKEKVVVSSDSEGSEFVKKVKKKADEKKRDMSKVKCYNCKKEGHFARDCKKAKIKDYNYYKIKMLFTKKDSDEQVLLGEDQA